MKEALFYKTLDNNAVRCELCEHLCVIPAGKIGVCGVRQNVSGELFSLVYGALLSQQVDPIEKKPLYHFLPASKSFSIATPGCNFSCQWCQNWQISQEPQSFVLPPTRPIGPEEIVGAAVDSGCRSIAYTYTEPTIFYEFAYDTAKLAKEAGIANIFVTNGYMSEAMLDHFHPYLDAANVDLKAFDKKTYQRLMGANLKPVLDSLKKMSALGIWLEVTTLVIPGVNDSEEELLDIATFISQELGPGTPWHISRFFPNHRMKDTSATPVETMLLAEKVGLEAGLKYVYLGNLHEEASNTKCPKCKNNLVLRLGYQTKLVGIMNGECSNCGEEISGVWE